jgi:Zn-finger nucleic acid-binding protein
MDDLKRALHTSSPDSHEVELAKNRCREYGVQSTEIDKIIRESRQPSRRGYTTKDR